MHLRTPGGCPSGPTGGRGRRLKAAFLLGAALPLAAAAAAPAGQSIARPAAGPMELQLLLPTARPGTAEPLLATGEAGRGDTIFVYHDEADRIRFGWDSSSAGVAYSPPMPRGGAGPHRLLVSMGSLVAPGPDDPAAEPTSEALLRGLLLVQFDGRTVLRFPGEFAAPVGPRTVTIGANRIGSALVQPFFTGEITAIRPVAPSRALAEAMQVGRWTASLAGAVARYPGAVRLRVRFSRAPAAAADPLVVTGRTGKGDFLYAQVVDAGHLRFGFDHWAVGGMTSPPIAADLTVVHEVAVTMDSLYPPDGQGESAAWRGQVAVWLDGHRVLSGPSACHPATAEEVILGYNLIGGSTTGPVFRGAILEVQAIAPAELARLGP